MLRNFRDDCHPLPFSTLQDFDASVATIGDADEFLQLISSSSSLYSLSVDVVVIPAPQELYSFLTTVHRSSSRDTLTAISLDDMAQVDLDAPLSHSLECTHDFTSLAVPKFATHIVRHSLWAGSNQQFSYDGYGIGMATSAYNSFSLLPSR